MIRILCFIFGLASMFSFAQTAVGIVQFNDDIVLNDHDLILNGAGERDKIYALGLYLDLGSNTADLDTGNKIASRDMTMALTFKVEAKKLEVKDWQNMFKVGLERATDGNSDLYNEKIKQFIGMFPETIRKFDIFTFLYEKGGKFTAFKDKKVLGTMANSLELKQILFRIWLGDNPIDEELRDKLMGFSEPNPVLGKWKTFDKNGVAKSVVLLYMIENKLFGVIEEMMSHAEQEAVCSKCQGKDKDKKFQGLVVLKDFSNKKDNKYVGEFLDTKSGKLCASQIWIDDEDKNVLNLKYKGSKGTYRWKKVIPKEEKK